MPTLAASKKALRVSKRKTAHNNNVRDNVERLVRKTKKLIKLGEAKLAAQQLPITYRSLDKAAKRGVISKRKSARMKSALALKVNSTAPHVKAAQKNT